MKKCFLIFLPFVFFVYSGKSQSFIYETDIDCVVSFCLPKYSPKEPTSVSPVKFLHPLNDQISLKFKLLVNQKNKIGFNISYGDYGYGYLISEPRSAASASVTGGGTNTFCNILKIGLLYQNIFLEYNHFMMSADFAFFIGKPIFNKYDFDTSVNSFFREPYPLYKQYLMQPPYISTKLVPLINVGFTCSYKIKERYSVNLGCTYQQGFKTIAIDYTSIEIPSENRKALYSAKFNGTATMANIGVSYRFGKKEYKN